MIKKFTPKYSGKDSTEFWKKINAIKNKSHHEMAYSLAVALQEHEETVLRIINNTI